MMHVKGIFRGSVIRACCALLSAGLVASAIPSAMAAQSLKAMRAQEAQEAALQREAAFTKELCGVDFGVFIDWRSFASWSEDVDVARACDRGLSVIETRCRKGKAPRITRFVCTGDGSGANYNGGTFVYGAG